jgi:hypothetical protein
VNRPVNSGDSGKWFLPFRPDYADSIGFVGFAIVDDGIDKTIFDGARILSVINEHGDPVILIFLRLIQGNDFSARWDGSLNPLK